MSHTQATAESVSNTISAVYSEVHASCIGVHGPGNAQKRSNCVYYKQAVDACIYVVPGTLLIEHNV